MILESPPEIESVIPEALLLHVDNLGCPRTVGTLCKILKGPPFHAIGGYSGVQGEYKCRSVAQSVKYED